MFAAAVFSQAPELAPGSTEAVVLPGSNYSFRVYDKALGFRVHVPPGASELSINFEPSTPGADVGLFVTAGAEHLDWRYGEDGQTPGFSRRLPVEDAGQFTDDRDHSGIQPGSGCRQRLSREPRSLRAVDRG